MNHRQPSGGEVGTLGWAVAVVAGGMVAGRTFGSGLLLNWDQVVGTTIPIPPGFRALGPELPRRVPFYGPLAVVSEIIGGPNTVAVTIWIVVVVACLGVVRLVGGGPAGVALGVVYSLSPFVLSRLAIGHLPLAAAAALLPHAMVDLADRRRRWLWAFVFAFTGSSGTVLGLVPLVIATVRRERSAARIRSLAVFAVAQSPWVVPGLLVVLGDGVLPEAASNLFRVRLDGVLGPARAVAGGGLFLAEEDVAARSGIPAALLGVLLLLGVTGLVRTGRKRDTAADRTAGSGRVRPDLLWSASAGVFLFVLPTVPGLAGVWDDVLFGPLAILRETHKFWPLLALPLLVGWGALVGAHVGEPAETARGQWLAAGLAGLTVVVGWSGLWGAGGRLEPGAEPAELTTIRSELAGGAHVVLALPWRRYGPTSLADGRTTLEPAPWLLDGEVIASGRAFVTLESEERSSTDHDAFARIDQQIRSGRPVSESLRALGVDRVVVLGSPDAGFYRRLGTEPGVQTLVDSAPGPSGGNLLLFGLDGVEGAARREADATWMLVGVAQLLAIGAVVRLGRLTTLSG